MRKNANKSYYHYSTEEYDKEGNIIDIRFYMTLKELENKFKKSRFTFNLVLNNPERRIKTLPNIKFKRVHLPVYNQVINDVFSNDLINEYNTDSSEDSNTEIEMIETLEDGSKNPIMTYN